MADIMTIEEMPILLRREVEARFIKPFLEEIEQELGKEKTKKIVTRVISKLAKEHGESAAKHYGKNALEDVPEISGHHAEGGALDLDIYKVGKNKLMMKTLRCEYCEMYERLGMEEWGCLLSCLRDEAFTKGINPNFRFERTEVLMAGGTCCDSLVIDTEGEK